LVSSVLKSKRISRDRFPVWFCRRWRCRSDVMDIVATKSIALAWLRVCVIVDSVFCNGNSWLTVFCVLFAKTWALGDIDSRWIHSGYIVFCSTTTPSFASRFVASLFWKLFRSLWWERCLNADLRNNSNRCSTFLFLEKSLYRRYSVDYLWYYAIELGYDYNFCGMFQNFSCQRRLLTATPAVFAQLAAYTSKQSFASVPSIVLDIDRDHLACNICSYFVDRGLITSLSSAASFA